MSDDCGVPDNEIPPQFRITPEMEESIQYHLQENKAAMRDSVAHIITWQKKAPWENGGDEGA